MAKSRRSEDFQARRHHRNGGDASEESGDLVEITIPPGSMDDLLERKRSQTVRGDLSDGQRVVANDGDRRHEATVQKSGKNWVLVDPGPKIEEDAFLADYYR